MIYDCCSSCELGSEFFLQCRLIPAVLSGWAVYQPTDESRPRYFPRRRQAGGSPSGTLGLPASRRRLPPCLAAARFGYPPSRLSAPLRSHPHNLEVHPLQSFNKMVNRIVHPIDKVDAVAFFFYLLRGEKDRAGEIERCPADQKYQK